MFLEEMKESYLSYVELYLADGTYRCYKNHLEYILNYLSNNDLVSSEDINNKNLTKFIINQHKQGVKNSTINKRLKVLKLMFKYCNVDNEILNLKNLKESYTTFTVLSESELNDLVNYLNSDSLSLQNKLIISLFIDTGMRLNELLNINIKNINFNNNSILLDITKTNESRIVPFTLATKQLLLEYLDSCNTELLFNVTFYAIESLFRRIKKKLKLNKFHPHMLRHGLSTKLNNNGVSLFVIQKIMGHKNVSTTQRYIHIDVDHILNCYNSVM